MPTWLDHGAGWMPAVSAAARLFGIAARDGT